MDELLAYYEKLSKMTAEELKDLWQETNCGTYNDMLEVLPPIRWKDGAFMVGECVTHGKAGAIYETYMVFAGRFFWRPAPLHQFNPLGYCLEIKHKFMDTEPAFFHDERDDSPDVDASGACYSDADQGL